MLDWNFCHLGMTGELLLTIPSPDVVLMTSFSLRRKHMVPLESLVDTVRVAVQVSCHDRV